MCAAPGSLLRIGELTRESVLSLLDRAEWLRANRCGWPSLAGCVVGMFFFQPSTRTRLGFTAAAVRLGAGTADLLESRFAEGMSRPESVEDTVRSVSTYFDALVLRHADACVVERTAACAEIPVINAGAGDDEHPTQALIDLFALRRLNPGLTGLRIGVVGDLAGSRSVHSLLRALDFFPPAEVRLISPPERRLPAELRCTLTFPTGELDRLELGGLDAVYVAGLPERCGAEHMPAPTRARYRLTPERTRELNPNAVILCPLPRIDEIDPAVDREGAARYFAQSRDGLFIRAAVLEQAMGG
jgi:aspartate carbamoyltransferase catalytic subunit